MGKWMMQIGIIVLIVLAMGLLTGQTRLTKIIKAEQFVLINAKGEKQAILGMIKNEPIFSFYDSKGVDEKRGTLLTN